MFKFCEDVMGQNWVENFKLSKMKASKANEPTGHVYFLGTSDGNFVDQLIQKKAPIWQKASLQKNERELVYFISDEGPYWIFKPKDHGRTHSTEIGESDYAWSRDSLGSLLAQFKAHQLDVVHMHFRGTSEEQDLGAFVGFEISSYSFKEQDLSNRKWPTVYFEKSLGSLKKNTITEALHIAEAVNKARHLVNLPPNQLNPKTFSAHVKSLKWSTKTKIEIWDQKRLQKEGMGLHLAVGQGASEAPCLVHIKYRPTLKKARRPVAFVGKGITFDTGGLDIKPSSGMRLMKKDMGGAAAVTALAWWVDQSAVAQPCDFYLALAENAVDAQAMRPSDIYTARNGLKIEIDNTDAEGRLVLADAIDVAVTQKKETDQPEVVVDVATLTGAIKVALGAEMAGLFSNDDVLAEQLKKASFQSGDLVWRMPLYEKYAAALSSPFADCKNSAEGFGGAITAALFLQKFVRQVKWAHLDIYGWTDKGSGAMPGAMSNGQAVQLLIEFLKNRSLEAK